MKKDWHAELGTLGSPFFNHNSYKRIEMVQSEYTSVMRKEAGILDRLL